ncbi:PTER [Branchiostoma lanceolatum]|uniref:N-acetyltaurine hydrolase n=1 Tax=Branchiostoma lanceolatum TaxID=7740 RepID=A0A8K0EL74_BRALA|nr:PTER [Branchiostoma lanceolatum]
MVLGPIEPENLGKTITHEHLVADFSIFQAPPPKHAPHMGTMSLNVENLGLIRQFPYSLLANINLHGEEHHMVEELKFYKKNGGCSIVECTSLGLSRDVGKLRKISKESGVNIICGTDSTHPSNMDAITQEDLVATMVRDITKGADGTDVRCGVIGEVGCSWPLTDNVNEKKVLKASATAQSETGCPVIIHPGRHTGTLALLPRSSGYCRRQGLTSEPRSCLLEWGFFGLEVSGSPWQSVSTDMPNDAMRINMIQRVTGGMHYGGHGYSHILLHVVPMMLRKGISQDDINKILIDNPRRWLTFN